MSKIDFTAFTQSPAVLAQEIDHYRNWRISGDLYTRALTGPVFYLIACLLMIWLADYIQKWSWLVALPPGGFLMFWVLRIHLKPLERDAGSAAHVRWQRSYWLLIQGSSALWGGVSALVCYLQAEADATVMVCLLATIAFSTAASHTFAMHPSQARIAVLGMILPSAILLLLPLLPLRSTGLTLLIYTFYLMANLRRSAREYAGQIETEIKLIQSQAELAQLSLIDALTGLPNRRSYESVWQQAWALAARKKEALGLLVLDLDHFKLINDRYGHPGGDACLQQFAHLLRQHIRRDSDVIARIGGEEFIVILPCTTIELSCAIAESLRVDLLQHPCVFEGESIPMTVSIGVGVADWIQDETPAATFSRVDQACYQAKREGRNRVVKT